MPYHRNYNYSDSQNNRGYPQNEDMKNIPTKQQRGTDAKKMQTPGQGGAIDAIPMMPLEMPPPTTVTSTYYTAGFLKQFLGRNMRVEFLIGTGGALVDRVGVLVEVGASYIVLQPYLTDDLLIADLYSIKFVYIYD